MTEFRHGRSGPGVCTPEELGELLARCALNDHVAFERLYQHSSAKLYGLVLRIVRDEQLARDILQDGFVKIWDRAGDFRPEVASPITWMGSIMRNRAIDLLRRRRASPVVMDLRPEDMHWLEDESVDQPDTMTNRSQEYAALQRCLNALNETQRQVVALAYFRGMTHEELASYLNAPLGTVKSWLRRGLLQLKACLDEK
jgi:RNA polymerase sigma-70 factor (ECF subfamily)